MGGWSGTELWTMPANSPLLVGQGTLLPQLQGGPTLPTSFAPMDFSLQDTSNAFGADPNSSDRTSFSWQDLAKHEADMEQLYPHGQEHVWRSSHVINDQPLFNKTQILSSQQGTHPPQPSDSQPGLETFHIPVPSSPVSSEIPGEASVIFVTRLKTDEKSGDSEYIVRIRADHNRESNPEKGQKKCLVELTKLEISQTEISKEGIIKEASTAVWARHVAQVKEKFGQSKSGTSCGKNSQKECDIGLFSLKAAIDKMSSEQLKNSSVFVGSHILHGQGVRAPVIWASWQIVTDDKVIASALKDDEESKRILTRLYRRRLRTRTRRPEKDLSKRPQEAGIGNRSDRGMALWRGKCYRTK